MAGPGVVTSTKQAGKRVKQFLSNGSHHSKHFTGPYTRPCTCYTILCPESVLHLLLFVLHYKYSKQSSTIAFTMRELTGCKQRWGWTQSACPLQVSLLFSILAVDIYSLPTFLLLSPNVYLSVFFVRASLFFVLFFSPS